MRVSAISAFARLRIGIPLAPAHFEEHEKKRPGLNDRPAIAQAETTGAETRALVGGAAAR